MHSVSEWDNYFRGKQTRKRKGMILVGWMWMPFQLEIQEAVIGKGLIFSRIFMEKNEKAL
jgi:hypothetical protein